MTCPSCGQENAPGTGRCGGCGALLPPASPQVSWADAATEAGPTSIPRGHTDHGRLRPGTQLGSRYEILSVLGEGGMGSVYKARDLELDRLVALKVIRPDLASHRDIVERFKREILLASQVTHRNVLRIHDLGEAGDIRFISMQYVEGRNLHEVLGAEGPMPLDRGLPLARQLADALQAAHDAGVVHRDLKPQNILLDESGTPFIADFGISRSLDSDGTMTDTGAVIGTVDYMSPEQARGETVDHRSDIYSLGVILYEMFTGSLPFKGGSSLSVMMKRLTEDAPTIRASRPQIPVWLSALVSRAMQRDPEARYGSARDLLRDLDRQRASIAWRRTLWKRAPIAAAGVLAVAGLAAASVFLWQSRAAASAQGAAAAPVAARASLALLPFSNATSDPNFDWVREGLPGTLAAELEQSRALRVMGAERVQEVLGALGLDDAGLARADNVARAMRLLKADHTLRGSLIRSGETFRLQATLWAAGGSEGKTIQVEGSGPSAVFAVADELAARVRQELGLSRERGETHRAVSEITTASVPALKAYTEGLALVRAGRDLEAAPRFEEAVSADPGFPLAHARLAETWSRLGRVDRAKAAAARAVDSKSRASDAEAARIEGIMARVAGDLEGAETAYEKLAGLLPNSAEALVDLARAREDRGDLQQAETTLRRVIEMDPGDARALYALARVMTRRGNPSDAVGVLNQALELHRQSQNEEGRATVLNGLGMTHRMIGRVEDAFKFFNESLEIRRRLGDVAGQATALRNIALLEGDLGKHEAAIARTKEAIELSRGTSDQARVAEGYLNLGDINLAAGRSREALEAYQQSLRIVQDLGDVTLLARTLSAAGYIHSVLGNYAEAGAMNKEALAKRRAIGDKGEILRALIDIGAIEQIQGRYEQAIQYDLEAQKTARDIGEKAGELVVAGNLSSVHEDQGSYAAALSLLAEAEPLARRLDDRSQLATLLIYLGSVRLRLGDLEHARAALDEGLPLARQAEILPIVVEGLMASGDLRREEGRPAEATPLYKEALDTAREAQDAWLTLRVRLRAAEAAGSLREIQAVRGEASRLGLAPLLAPARLAAARLLAAAGRHADALAEAQGAVEDATKLQQRDLMLQAHHLAAQELVKIGQSQEAAAHLSAGQESLDRMKSGLDDEALKVFLARPRTAGFLRQTGASGGAPNR